MHFTYKTKTLSLNYPSMEDEYVLHHCVSYAYFDIPFLYYIKDEMEFLSSVSLEFFQQRNTATFRLDT